MSVTLVVNGLPHQLDIDPDTPLIFALRNELACYGARLGCGLEQCGACLVLSDGEPCYACTTRVADVAGKDIETVEGLISESGALHPLQQAILNHNAAQCGYCIGGILMRAKALLADKPHPSRAEICAALDPHLCRCGAQPRIVHAIQSAAARMRGAS